VQALATGVGGPMSVGWCWWIDVGGLMSEDRYWCIGIGWFEASCVFVNI